jgi:2-methylcitrate dehydratase PrpD
VTPPSFSAPSISSTTTRAFVDDLRSRLPGRPETRTAARELVLDVLGVGIAGSQTTEGRTVLDTMSALRSPGPSPVFLAGRGFDVATAALVNGTMAYSLGLTDTHSQSITHPGCSVVAAALAMGAHTSADDDAILDAVIAGVETVVRVGGVINPTHRGRGFHPTATCNPFGVAVAASMLLAASVEETLNALGIAGSSAGGLYEFRHTGGMLMALHGGWPAHSGIVAALLAREGFTGPDTVLEGPEGFFAAFADEIRPEQLALPDLGEPMGVQELSLRPYNACRYAHSGIDALALIEAEHGRVDPDDVLSLTVHTHRVAVEQECEPTTLVAARLSTAFTIASTYVNGPSLVALTEADLHDEAILRLFERVEICEDPRLTELFPRLWASRVTLETRDGRVMEAEVTTPRGEPTNPLSRDDIVEKFRRLAEPVTGEERTDALVAAVLDGTEPLRDVLAAVSAPAAIGTEVLR